VKGVVITAVDDEFGCGREAAQCRDVIVKVTDEKSRTGRRRAKAHRSAQEGRQEDTRCFWFQHRRRCALRCADAAVDLAALLSATWAGEVSVKRGESNLARRTCPAAGEGLLLPDASRDAAIERPTCRPDISATNRSIAPPRQRGTFRIATARTPNGDLRDVSRCARPRTFSKRTRGRYH